MTVLLFSRAREIAGCAVWEMDVTEPLRAEEIWERMIAVYPELAGIRAVTRLARNGVFAGEGAMFYPSDEVALIPPVSGG